MEQPKKVRFNFIKSNYFRVVHMDGAHGGVTPHGQIFVSVYNERAPIPQATLHVVDSAGTLGKEAREERIVKEGLVREVEVGMIMDLATAESLHQWLGEKIATLKEIQQKAASKQS